MRVQVLGPVGIWVSGVELSVPAGKPRALLAMLALAEGRPVSVDQLLTGLWGQEPPRTAVQTLRVHVSTLRSRLREAGSALVMSASGYRLEIDPANVDVACFERLAGSGFNAFNEDRLDVASRSLQGALEQWSGEPLANVLDAPFAAHEAERLTLRRHAVVQARIEADLSLGLGVTLVDETRAIAEANPYDERACGQLMIALYRAGQAAAALNAYQTLRASLGDELGLDVGPELVELERQVLVHDDRLLARPRRQPGPGHNLPEETSTFIGRSAELVDLAAMMTRSRLVTLTGAGGTGKTRLAVRLAHQQLDRFQDGTWLLELAPLTSAELVSTGLAETVGARIADGLDGLIEHIGARTVLIVLDNCEHLIDSVAAAADELLRRCRNLRILATSREPLGIEGEQVYRVPPLGLVPIGADAVAARASDAVQLFADRATSQRSDFSIGDDAAVTTITQICARLDGLPLAIELAAARLRTMPLHKLAEHLDQRFRVLTGASRRTLPRQQTLRALIDWSYDLLTDGEQLMLDRLSVFVGAFSIEAVEAVAGRDGGAADPVATLMALVDKSLVESNPGGSALYRLLETIREYAAERLSRRAIELVHAAREDHARCYLALAESAAPALDHGRGQHAWLERLDAARDNIRAAADLFLTDPSLTTEGLRLANALRQYWDSRGYFREGAALTLGLLDRDRAPSSHTVIALCTATDLLERLDDLDTAADLIERAVDQATQLDSAELRLEAIPRQALIVARRGEPRRALELADSLLGIKMSDSQAGKLHMVRSYILQQVDDLAGSRSALEAAMTAATSAMNDRRRAIVLTNLACIDTAEDDLDAADQHLHASQVIASQLGDDTISAYINMNLGVIALQQGDYARAWVHYREALPYLVSGEISSVNGTLLGLALCASAQGDLREAATLHGVIDRQHTSLDPTERSLRATNLERLRADLGDDEFERLLAHGRTLSPSEALEMASKLRQRDVEPAG